MIWTFIKDNYEVIVALSSVILSTCALVVSFFGLRHQRKFNLLSVRPAIKIDVSDYTNKWEIALTNKGLGPLQVTNFQVVSSDGKHKRNLVEFMPELPKDTAWDTFYWNVCGEIIKAGDSITVLRLCPERLDAHPEIRQKIRRTLGELTVKVEGKDFYGYPTPPYSYAIDIFKKGFVSES